MEDQIYYYHGKTVDGYRYTIAGYFPTEDILSTAIAFCSKKDQFCKAKGRLKALSKLEGGAKTGTFEFTSYPHGRSERQIFCAEMDSLKLLDKEAVFNMFHMKYIPNGKS